MEPLDVVNEKWDYLVILDACRYDYFKKMYSRFLSGDLHKRISAGTCTNDWRDKSFPDRYEDIVYVSANPFFAKDIEVYGYTAGEHFYDVYEVWRDSWDRGLVLPEQVTKTALKAISENPGKRFIIHYLQPHTPYIILGEDARGYEEAQGEAGRKIAGEAEYKKASKYKKKIADIMEKLLKNSNILGNHPEWYVRKWFGLPPRSPMELVIREYNTKVLRNAYSSNLRTVLEEVAKFVYCLSGKVVISSDHGELLGERRCFAHPANSDNPILREIPWLLIDKGQKQNLNMMDAEETTASFRQDTPDAEEIEKKLQDLGYI